MYSCIQQPTQTLTWGKLTCGDSGPRMALALAMASNPATQQREDAGKGERNRRQGVRVGVGSATDDSAAAAAASERGQVALVRHTGVPMILEPPAKPMYIVKYLFSRPVAPRLHCPSCLVCALLKY